MDLNAQEIIKSSEEKMRKEFETKRQLESIHQEEEIERLKSEQQASRDLLRKQDEEKRVGHQDVCGLSPDNDEICTKKRKG